MRGLTVGIAVVAVLLAGCSDTSSVGGTPTPGVVTTSAETSEPSPEPTGPETTQTKQQQPSIEIASLPIGGSPSDDHPQCNPANWLGGDAVPIPAGTTIKLGTPDFDPRGVFELDQSACPGDAPACEGFEWTSDKQDTCFVGIKQVANDGSTSLIIPAEATCATQSDCDGLKQAGGSQIPLTARPSEPPSETPSETPTTETSPSG